MSGGGAVEGGRTWSRHHRRPYTVTGGRTRPAHDELELETLVLTVTGVDEQLAGLGREQRSIAALCREVVSVAEISARLDLLTGVTPCSSATWPSKAWWCCTGRRPPSQTLTSCLWSFWRGCCMASGTSRCDPRRAVALLVGARCSPPVARSEAAT